MSEQPTTNCERCLAKMTVRNFITVATISVFLFLVIYIVSVDPIITENPVLMFILGAFVPTVTMIYTFYYRKNPSKNKKRKKFNDNFEDEDLSNICPCCGQELKPLDT